MVRIDHKNKQMCDSLITSSGPLVGVLSEGRVDAFSQNPKSISSSESDSEGWGSGTEGLKSHMMVIVIRTEWKFEGLGRKRGEKIARYM